MAAMIAMWRKLRHPRLAKIVDCIEDQVLASAPRPPLCQTRRRIDIEAWRTTEAAGDPLDFHRLSAAVGAGSQNDTLCQVKALAARQDPRLARVLLALLEQPPHHDDELLDAILEELAATRDRRAAGPADALAARYLDSAWTGGLGYVGANRWISENLKAVASELEAVVPAALTGAIAAACVELEARFGAHSAGSALPATHQLRELLAAVYAAPDDDGPRLVYADALLAQGDPRGELVILQLARARGVITDEGRAREAAILSDEAHMAAWGQPLSSAGRCTFERGFPAVVDLHRGAKAVLGGPSWATITGVRELSAVSEQVARHVCELPGLRSVEMLPVPLLEELCRTSRRWTRVGVEGSRPPSPEALAALPELRDLSLQIPGRYDAVDLPPTLERLHISTGALPHLMLERLTHLEELRLEFRYAEPLSIPASLQRLALDSRGPLPPIAFARPSSLRSAKFSGDVLAAERLRDLASLEELDLFLLRLAGAFEGLERLRRLSIARSSIEPDALASLASLEELEVRGIHSDGALRLEGCPLRILSWSAPIAQIPDGLPLRCVKVHMPEALDDLERFVARYPALERLELTALHGTKLKRAGARSWCRLVAIFEQSGIGSLQLQIRGYAMTLERDAEGRLSRLRLGGSDFESAEHLAHALTRVTSIESATKLPPRLAKLVR